MQTLIKDLVWSQSILRPVEIFRLTYYYKIMKKIRILLLALILMTLPLFSLAQNASGEELANPGLSLGSPFYFFDRFGEWVRMNVLTFNAKKKAELKIKYAEERLAELDKVAVSPSVSEEIVEKAQDRADKFAEEAVSRAEMLGQGGREIPDLIEKLNNYSLKREAVLERVFEKAPEQAKPVIAKAIENSPERFKKIRDILAKQLDKGLIDKDRASKIIELTTNYLEKNLAENKKIAEEEEREVGALSLETKNKLERKFRILEDHLFDLNSKKPFLAFKEKLATTSETAAKIILENRRDFQMQDKDIEEILEKIKERKFEPAQEAAEAIQEAEDKLSELELLIIKWQEAGRELPKNVVSLVKNAKEHLDLAKKDYENEKFGQAFGLAMSAKREAKSAIGFLKEIFENKEEIKEKFNDIKEEVSKLKDEIAQYKERFGSVPDKVIVIIEKIERALAEFESLLNQDRLARAKELSFIIKKMLSQAEDILDIESEFKEKGREIKEELFELESPETERLIEPQKKELRKIKIPEKIELRNEGLKESPEAEVPQLNIKTLPVLEVKEIIITNKGFEPEKIEIKNGMKVRWFNKSSRRSWPASNIHPTHGQYPEKGGCIGSAFDACRGLGPGESYEFTFQKEGAWGYHDHLSPRFQGVVIVK